MRDIHCPKDIGFNNIFIGEDCKKEQWYDNCYHCWSSAIAENNQKYFKRKFEEELEKIKQEIQSIIALADSRGEDTKLAYQCQTVITEKISELKENNTQKSEPDDFHEYWDEMAISELKGESNG